MNCSANWIAGTETLIVIPSYTYTDYSDMEHPVQVIVPKTTPLIIWINGLYVIVGGFADLAAFTAGGAIPLGKYLMTYRGSRSTSLNSGDGINGGYGMNAGTKDYTGTIGTHVDKEGPLYESRNFYLTAAGLAYQYTGYDIPSGIDPILATHNCYILEGTGALATPTSMDEVSAMRYRIRFTGLSGSLSGMTFTGGGNANDAQDIISGKWIYFENVSWMRFVLRGVGESVSFELVRVSDGLWDDRDFIFHPEHNSYVGFSPPYYAANTVSI
jgi:hypothetical protein